MLMAKFVTSMAAALLVVSEPLTAKAFDFLNAEKHTTRGVTRAMLPERSAPQQRLC